MLMYINIMGRRMQITLTDRQHAFLKDEALRTGLSMAELIRRGVDLTYRPFTRPTIRGFELSVGMWRQPDAAVAGRQVKTRTKKP